MAHPLVPTLGTHSRHSPQSSRLLASRQALLEHRSRVKSKPLSNTHGNSPVREVRFVRVLPVSCNLLVRSTSEPWLE